MPAHADSLALLPLLHVCAHGVNAASHLVAGNTRKCQAGPDALLDYNVTVTNATGFDFDPDFAAARRRDLPLHQLKISMSFADLRNFHSSHDSGPR
jgi:hypothetical protein